jgi:polysaccharide pyruvyl transferase WcaK-like protein
MQNITLATIRDEMSYNMLLDMGIGGEKIHLTADEVITVKQNKYLDAYKRDFKEYIKGDYAVISVRKWKSAGAAFFAEFAAAVESLCRENRLIPVYVVMEPKTDKSLSEYLAGLNSKGYVIKGTETGIQPEIEKIVTVVRSAAAVISMRLHTAIFAAAFGIPVIGISYDPKVQGFLNDIFGNDDYTVGIQEFNKDALIQKFSALMSRRDEITAQVENSAARLCEKAKQNAELFINEIDETDGTR